MAIIYGQNLRVMVGSKCIAYATDCTAHIGVNFDDVTSKDSTGSWDEKVPVGKTWDLSVSSLVAYKDSADTTGVYVADIFDTLAADTLVTVKFTSTSGTLNREEIVGKTEWTGSAYVSDISVKATNRQKATADVKIDGTGALTKSTVPTPPSGGKD